MLLNAPLNTPMYIISDSTQKKQGVIHGARMCELLDAFVTLNAVDVIA